MSSSTPGRLNSPLDNPESSRRFAPAALRPFEREPLERLVLAFSEPSACRWRLVRAQDLLWRSWTSTTVEACRPSSASSRASQEAPTSFGPGSALTDSLTRHATLFTLVRPAGRRERHGALIGRHSQDASPRPLSSPPPLCRPWAGCARTPRAAPSSFPSKAQKWRCRILRRSRPAPLGHPRRAAAQVMRPRPIGLRNS
jgi:hypothetical protein